MGVERPGIAKVLCAAALVLLPVEGFAMNLKGRVSESVLYVTDDSAKQNYSYTWSKLRLDATDIYGNKENSAHFDGAYTGASSNVYNSQTPPTRINYANLKMEKLFYDTDVVLGRQAIDDLVGARLDGALFDMHSSDAAGLGVFGGTMPDPYMDYFSSGFLTFGGFGYYKKKEAGVTLGYAESLYNGNEDQAYIYGSTYLAPTDEFDVNGSARLDHNAGNTSGYDFTNLLVNANYRSGWRANLNLTYNQYRAVWYQASETMNYGLDMALQKSARVFTDVALVPTVKVYADYDYRIRDSDGLSASLLMVGLKENDLMEIFYYNVSYRNINYFTAVSWQGALAVGAQFNEKATAELGAAYSENQQNQTSNGMTQIIYTASADYTASKSWMFNCSVETSTQKFVSVDSVYLSKYNDQYQTTTVFANLTYRF